MRMTIVMFAALGLVTSACGKKATTQPDATKAAEPTTAPEPTKAAEPDAAAPAKEDVAAAPAKEDVAVAQADAAAPPRVFKDKAEWVTAVLDGYAAGKFDESFAELADDAIWYELGSPMMPEVKGKAGVIDFHKKNTAGWSEMKFKATRVIDAGEFVAVEAIWSGKNTGEMMGKPATDKVATVPGAFIVHMVDGRVDKVWNVFDFTIAMTQIGLMPGEAQAAAPMMESPELVTGPINAANAESYKANTEKLGADTVEAIMKAYAAEDMVQYDGFTGKTITGLADNIAFMTTLMKGMGDFKIVVDNVWGAGDWLFAAQTVSFTYKGGFGDIPAKDQKVALPVLAFTKWGDGKIKSYRDYANGMGMLAQLGVDLGGAAPKPPDAVVAEEGKIGIEACDQYIAAMKACLGALNGPTLEAAQKGFDMAMKSWKDTLAATGEQAKAGIETGCKAALEGAKNMGAMCPNVKWE